MKLNLADKLRCNNVKRWHLNGAGQNIAEHQFNVAHISIYVLHEIDRLNNHEHDIQEEMRVVYLALHHDIKEVIMGDIPTHLKGIGNVKEMVDAIESCIDPYVSDNINLKFNNKEKAVVKIADMIDALVYCSRYAEKGRYNDKAIEDIENGIFNYVMTSGVIPENSVYEFMEYILNSIDVKNEHSILEGIYK